MQKGTIMKMATPISAGALNSQPVSASWVRVFMPLKRSFFNQFHILYEEEKGERRRRSPFQCYSLFQPFSTMMSSMDWAVAVRVSPASAPAMMSAMADCIAL